MANRVQRHRSTICDPRLTILVVTGDPGGARVLIPGILALRRRHPRWDFRVCAGSNSLALWKAAGFRPRPWPAAWLDRAACRKILGRENPDLLVTGTSFENPTESHFRAVARGLGLASFSVLDHWCNYRHRYELGGRLVLPNRIGVMDALAREKMVRAGIPGKYLTIVGHPVLEPFLSGVKRAKFSGRRILFLSEPISWNGKLNPRVVCYPKHNEMTILRDLLKVFRMCPELGRFSLHIRPHPLEPVSRIRAICRLHTPAGLKVVIDRSRSLEKDLGASRVVLGITSIALLQAALAGRPVLSLQSDLARGRIPDDILCFLPRVRAKRCFIEAVSKFVRARRAVGGSFVRGRLPKFPTDSAVRMARVMESLVHA